MADPYKCCSLARRGALVCQRLLRTSNTIQRPYRKLACCVYVKLESCLLHLGHTKWFCRPFIFSSHGLSLEGWATFRCSDGQCTEYHFTRYLEKTWVETLVAKTEIDIVFVNMWLWISVLLFVSWEWLLHQNRAVHLCCLSLP